MKHILTIIGARPQIIKAAAISRVVEGYPNQIREHILHTGQHYDANMSEVFFDELGIPRPEYNLGVGSGSHGVQTGKMIEGIEKVLLSRPFDGIILYGDTNSTLAGAIAASKLHVPIFHVEAGLRSFNMTMPEEVNRIVCDRLSTLLFAPTVTAVDNLHAEGFGTTHCPGKVILSGDVMYDNSIHFADLASSRSDVLQRVGVTPGGYILATVHRDNNTDNPARLSAILQGIAEVAQRESIPVVIPLHPRTCARLKDLQPAVLNTNLIKLLPPLSFLEMTLMEQNARLIMTDSGGVQKEAFFFKRPCVILRPETEWVEIVKHHAGIIADADSTRIVESCHTLLTHPPLDYPTLFGDGNAARRIIDEIVNQLECKSC